MRRTASPSRPACVRPSPTASTSPKARALPRRGTRRTSSRQRLQEDPPRRRRRQRATPRRPALHDRQRGAPSSPTDRGASRSRLRLLEFAGISREATVIGVQDHIEIWDRAAWGEYLAHLEEEADATARRPCDLASTRWCSRTRRSFSRSLSSCSGPCPARSRSTARSAPAVTPPRSPSASARTACCSPATATRNVAEYFRDVERAAPCETRLYHGNFADVLARIRDASADMVYMDLGVSSMQLDRRERGFSYAYDAPLDMRMDPELPSPRPTSSTRSREDELADIFRRYGEERYAKNIARGIVRTRARKPLETTGELVEIVKAQHPDAGALRRGQPGAARLPGAAHRRQRRAGVARARPGRGLPRAAARRPPGGDQLPLARGPDGQGVLPAGTPRAASARPACRSASAGTSRR